MKRVTTDCDLCGKKDIINFCEVCLAVDKEPDPSGNGTTLITEGVEFCEDCYKKVLNTLLKVILKEEKYNLSFNRCLIKEIKSLKTRK